jgi:uncharacterized protein YjdB
VSWESSDPSVASVTGSTANINGAVITAHKTGKATISAVIGNSVPGGKASITKKLTVKVGPSSEAADSVKILSGNKIISDTAEDNRILIGKALTLKAVVYKDGTALKTGEANVLWSSSDPGIATVNNKGKVTSYREGKVTVTVTVVPKDAGSEPVSASCNLYIYNPVKHMQWNLYNLSTGNIEKADVKSLTAAQGERFILGLNYTVEPKTGLDPVRESKSFEYSISDKNVVTVEKTGGLNLRFIAKGPGKAVITIRAKDGSNKTAKCTVKVLGSVQGLEIAAKNLGSAKAEPVQGISITVTGLAMSKSFKLAPVISPAKAVDKKVVYMSSNTAAVTVSSTGVVKRCGEGAADIYVITADGGCTAVCHVAEN